MLLLSHIKDRKTKAQKKVTAQGYTICNLKGRDSNPGHLTPGIRLLTPAAFHCREPMYQSKKHEGWKTVSEPRQSYSEALALLRVDSPTRQNDCNARGLSQQQERPLRSASSRSQATCIPPWVSPSTAVYAWSGQPIYIHSMLRYFNSAVIYLTRSWEKAHQDHEIGYALWVPQCESKYLASQEAPPAPKWALCPCQVPVG